MKPACRVRQTARAADLPLLAGVLLVAVLLVAAPLVNITSAQIDRCTGGAPWRLVVGERARVLPPAGINLRNTPGLNSTILDILPGGAEIMVVSGPICAADYSWWQVDYGLMRGWAAESFGEQYWLEPVITLDAQIDSLRLSVPQGLAESVETERVPAYIDPDEPSLNEPPGRRFNLIGYPYGSALPMISAYATDSLEDMTGGAQEFLEALRERLENPSDDDFAPGLMPDIPGVRLVVSAQEAVIDFIDGAGLRRVIVLVPDTVPRPLATQGTGALVVLLFQGLSDDGETYLQGLLPLPESLLPLSADFGPEQADFAARRAAADESLRALLDAEPLAVDLAPIDNLLRSLWTSAPVMPQSPVTLIYRYENAFELRHSPQIASAISAEVVPVSDRQPVRHLRLEPIDYPVLNYIEPPSLAIYRAADVRLSGQIEALAALSRLRDLLDARPADLDALTLPLFDLPVTPLTPPIYMRFSPGDGLMTVAALTQPGQPVSERQLVLIFQGLTDDGEFYLRGIFPLSAAAFQTPVRDPVPIAIGLSPDAYRPDLNQLRDMLSSISIRIAP